ncbi:SWI/SNF-related matrix-associated actin-dependent regulator of chromatin subfamily E member 1-like isoform X5 [Homarus americanus]|uniref:SWI/SNF-related matrix-associated actin-dependent regulator of chromatin subfamily E member 1-like isoform X5 n=2 Tax=Homarus americanus TaxID=6706 RepID=UPI001C441EFA|nr:SWI/SNF-related matrix-associated actin-dependent regulator of chromatin subfamily E member 1-like isoform X5 [Homarus americanus]
MTADINSSNIRPRPVPDAFAPGLRMSLPTNYRQVAMMGPTPTPGPTQSVVPGGRVKATTTSSSSTSSGNGGSGSSKGRPTDRLARTPSTPSSTSKGVGEANVPSPFTPPVHGNPAFNPQKMGTGKGGVSKQSGEGRIPKPPKAPDKPLMPYMRYSRKVWDQVKAANNDLKLWEIGKIIGSMWRDLPEADKQDFVDEYESEKADYTKALEAYHSSPAYQQYLAAKSKGSLPPAGTAATEEKEILDRSSSTVTTGTKLDRRIDIQPAEDEDDYDDGLSVKHVAHSRYVRNHRLINEIFSDTVVPDVRSVVTSQRLTVLRRQVQSLTMHQKKLETELQQIEEKFEAKKRKFVEAGDSFQGELKKVKAMAPKLDEASFVAMVERQKEILRREAEERQRTAQGLPPRPSSTSSSQATPAGNSSAREDSNEAAGPAPQNTATPVDAAPSPAPMQENDMGGDDENKMEASTGVTSAAATSAPNVPVPSNATPAAPAVNGPISAAPSNAQPTVSGAPVQQPSVPTTSVHATPTQINPTGTTHTNMIPSIHQGHTQVTPTNAAPVSMVPSNPPQMGSVHAGPPQVPPSNAAAGNLAPPHPPQMSSVHSGPPQMAPNNQTPGNMVPPLPGHMGTVHGGPPQMASAGTQLGNMVPSHPAPSQAVPSPQPSTPSS